MRFPFDVGPCIIKAVKQKRSEYAGNHEISASAPG